MKPATFLLLLLAGPSLAAPSAISASGTAREENGPRAAPLPRKILALYDREGIEGGFKDVYLTQLHQRAEMPLNHLGMELVYRDAAGPLPDPAELSGYRGVLTWFERPAAFADPDPFCSWLARAADAGLKVVVMGEPGVRRPGKDGRLSPACHRAFARLGVALGETRAADPLYMEVLWKDARMTEFERKLSLAEVREAPVVHPLAGTRSFLSLALRQEPGTTTHPVVVTRAGGLALHPFVVYNELGIKPHQVRWRVEPFAFFELAFGLQGWPRPDTITLNGRRIYFTHVDGDGFFNPSEASPVRLSGEVFLHEFLERWPDSPFTISVITGHYEEPRHARREWIDLSRRILNLPNVEPASHGYAHPMVWHKGTLGLSLPGYAYDAAREIAGSIQTINDRFLATGRRAGLFLWTGDALPGEAELKIAKDAGLANLNGGMTRFDRRHMSYAYVSPLGRTAGSLRQIYAPNSNENVYTGLWRGPFYGFREVLETFRNTESPRRVKPANVYIHFYSAEKVAALRALQQVYEWVHEQPYFPLRAGEFAAVASQFFDMRIERREDGSFLLRGAPAVRTVRFDGEERLPDLPRCRGVLGFRRHQGSLYVFLDEGAERVVALGGGAPAGPYLSKANFEATRWRVEGGRLSFLKRGWWKGELVLGGMEPSAAYGVRCRGRSLRLRSGEDGSLVVRFPDSELGGPPSPVEVERL